MRLTSIWCKETHWAHPGSQSASFCSESLNPLSFLLRRSVQILSPFSSYIGSIFVRDTSCRVSLSSFQYITAFSFFGNRSQACSGKHLKISSRRHDGRLLRIPAPRRRPLSWMTGLRTRARNIADFPGQTDPNISFCHGSKFNRPVKVEMT